MGGSRYSLVPRSEFFFLNHGPAPKQKNPGIAGSQGGRGGVEGLISPSLSLMFAPWLLPQSLLVWVGTQGMNMKMKLLHCEFRGLGWLAGNGAWVFGKLGQWLGLILLDLLRKDKARERKPSLKT